MLAACEYYGCTRVALLTTCREHPFVMRRYSVMYLIKHLTTHSLPSIGRQFGGYDHTTVMHAVRRVEEMLDGRLMLNRLAKYEGVAGNLMRANIEFRRDMKNITDMRKNIAGIRDVLRTQYGF